MRVAAGQSGPGAGLTGVAKSRVRKATPMSPWRRSRHKQSAGEKHQGLQQPQPPWQAGRAHCSDTPSAHRAMPPPTMPAALATTTHPPIHPPTCDHAQQPGGRGVEQAHHPHALPGLALGGQGGGIGHLVHLLAQAQPACQQLHEPDHLALRVGGGEGWGRGLGGGGGGGAGDLASQPAAA